MKKIIIVLVCLVFVFCASYASTEDKITLKSGKIVEGKIFENTNEKVKIETCGVVLTYYKDEIKSIDAGPTEIYYPEEYTDDTVVIEGKTYHKVPRVVEDGKGEGPFKEYYENGQIKREGIYKDGKKDGPYRIYWENGQLQLEETYKDGKREGLHKSYHKNGKLGAEGTFKGDKQDGPYKVYYETGQLRQEGRMRDDEEAGRPKIYNKDGLRIQ